VSKPCLSCGGQGEPLRLRDDYPLARCTRCNLVYAEAWIEGFDLSHDRYHAERLAQPLEQLYPRFNQARLETVLAYLSSLVAGRGLLDVGCGQGQLVFAARTLGWHAKGIDLSEAAISICKAAGLDCSVTDFFSPELDDSRFTLITMTEFIEHVPHPTEFLTRARELLAKEGLVYLTTPNFSSLGRRILGGDWAAIGPGHTTYFTPSMLRQISRESGLEPIALFTKNLSLDALRRLLGRRTGASNRGLNGERQSDEPSEDQRFRERLDQSGTLRAMKRAANTVLRATSLGETLIALLCRPSERHAFERVRTSRL
jgi:2-polyprenyl-3-methyl-5-hydroxy-6-metoxy-1,4-benzoquinol methylase